MDHCHYNRGCWRWQSRVVCGDRSSLGRSITSETCQLYYVCGIIELIYFVAVAFNQGQFLHKLSAHQWSEQQNGFGWSAVLFCWKTAVSDTVLMLIGCVFVCVALPCSDHIMEPRCTICHCFLFPFCLYFYMSHSLCTHPHSEMLGGPSSSPSVVFMPTGSLQPDCVRVCPQASVLGPFSGSCSGPGSGPDLLVWGMVYILVESVDKQYLTLRANGLLECGEPLMSRTKERKKPNKKYKA